MHAASIVVVLLMLLLPAGAGAAPIWLPTETVSEPGDENAPADVAVAPDGTAIVVWQRASCKIGGGDSHECQNGKVQYAVRPPGGSFSAPADMQGDPFAANRANPQVAVDSGGNAIAAWSSNSGENARIRYAFRPAGGDFGGSKTLVDASGTFHNFPSVAMAPNGRAVIAFLRQVGGKDAASYAVREPGGDFGAAKSFAGDPGTSVNQAPDVRLDANGGGIANWASLGVGVFIRYATITPGAADFNATETVEQGFANMAMAPSGAAAMIWNLSGSAQDLRYAFRPPGGSFGPPQTLVEPVGPLGPRVAVAPDGSTVAAWTSLVAPDSFVHWATAPAGGPFGAPTPVGPGVEGSLNDLDVSDAGTSLALWTSFDEGQSTMHAALRPLGGAFGNLVSLPSPPQGANFGGATSDFDAGGNAAAVWFGRDPTIASAHDVPLLAAWLENRPDPVVEDTTAIAITKLRVQPRRFSVRRGKRAQTSRAYGAKIRFRLSRRATVRFVVQQPKRGVRVRIRGKNRCLPRTRRNLRRGKGRCTRFKRIRRFARPNRKQGLNVIRFSGRFGRKVLGPGRYRLVAFAVDGSQRSKARRAGFRVRSR